MKLDQIFKVRVCRPNGLIKNIVSCCIMRKYRKTRIKIMCLCMSQYCGPNVYFTFFPNILCNWNRWSTKFFNCYFLTYFFTNTIQAQLLLSTCVSSFSPMFSACVFNCAISCIKKPLINNLPSVDRCA